MIARQIFYTGRVQGVGFRFSVKHLAKGFEVTGWVRNLPDGRVEMQVMGDVVEVGEFLQEIQDSHLGGFIREKEEHVISLLENCPGFSIR
jgi:acylphosphatase